MATNDNSSTGPAGTAAGGGNTAGSKKKLKGKTVDLTEFLNKPINWAEEMEEMSLTPADPDHSSGYGGDYAAIEVRTEIIQKRSQLPTAPKAALSSTVDATRVPMTPPFNAYIGNVSYDASEDDVERFFKGLRVIKVRLMRDGSRVKGFGYVEFETRDDLLEALEMDKQRLLNREIKIDLADRPNEHSQRQSSYGTGRGGRQQRMGGYDSDKGRDREQETSGDWRVNARPSVGPPSPYDDRRSQPRTGAPPLRQMQQTQPAYGYAPPQQHSHAPPAYAPQQGYGRPPDEYAAPPQHFQRGPSGYDSDYTGGRGGYGAGGYDTYPMMRQASYSSQYSGYASDREGGHYRRGLQGSGFYGSMRRDQRGGDRYGSGQHMDRYHGDGYNAPAYQAGYNQNQSYYQDGYGTYGRQQRRGGGYGRGPPPSHRGEQQYGYNQATYGGAHRNEEPTAGPDAADGSSEAANRLKERPRLSLQPRTLPLPSADAGPGPTESDTTNYEQQEQQQQPPSETRRPSGAPQATVFGGARPVDTAAREREVEEKIRREQEEFRRQEEERKQQQQQQQQPHVRKLSGGPGRVSTGGRRRTSDSQYSSTGGGAHLKGVDETSSKEFEDESGGQMKILQRSRTAPVDSGNSRRVADTTSDASEQFNEEHQRQQHSHRSSRAGPPSSQNYWAGQNERRRRTDQKGDQHEDEAGATVEEQDCKRDEIGEVEGGEECSNDHPSNISERQLVGISQSKSLENEPHQEHHPENGEGEDAVFKNQQHPQYHERHGHHGGRKPYGGGRRGGRGGGQYRPGQFHQDPAALPPRFARERDQQHFQRRGSSQTDDGQEHHSDRRRPSKDLVFRRSAQGPHSPGGASGRRGSAAAASGRPHPARQDSRDRNSHKDRRQQQQHRRGSADVTFPPVAQQQDEDAQQATAKPPAHPRRQQQQAHAPGSRKSSATPSLPVADAPSVSFESRNKFEMLLTDTGDD